jgi:hypothetical protein
VLAFVLVRRRQRLLCFFSCCCRLRFTNRRSLRIDASCGTRFALSSRKWPSIEHRRLWPLVAGRERVCRTRAIRAPPSRGPFARMRLPPASVCGPWGAHHRGRRSAIAIHQFVRRDAERELDYRSSALFPLFFFRMQKLIRRGRT